MELKRPDLDREEVTRSILDPYFRLTIESKDGNTDEFLRDLKTLFNGLQYHADGPGVISMRLAAPLDQNHIVHHGFNTEFNTLHVTQIYIQPYHRKE